MRIILDSRAFFGTKRSQVQILSPRPQSFRISVLKDFFIRDCPTSCKTAHPILQIHPPRVIISDMPPFGCSPINNDNCGLMSICVSPPTANKKKSVKSRNSLNRRYLPNHHSDMDGRFSEIYAARQDKKTPFRT